MKDLRNMWTINGFLKDENKDKVPDGIDVFIDIKGKFPIGLIDFSARLGLETTAANLSLFEDEGKNYHLRVIRSVDKQITICRLLNENIVEISGVDDDGINAILRFLAADWPHCIDHEVEECVTAIALDNKQKVITLLNFESLTIHSIPMYIMTAKNNVPENPTFQGISDLWTVKGLYQNGRIDVTSQTNIMFTFSGEPHTNVLKQSALLSLRLGLFSTGIQFPLTDDSNNLSRGPELQFHIVENEDDVGQITWQSNNWESVSVPMIHISGSEQSVLTALKYITEATPLDEGGDLGVWEAVSSHKIDTVHPLFDKKWNDKGEKEEALELIETLKGLFKEEEAISILLYLSEPSSIREQVKAQIKNTFESSGVLLADISVRSAFKTGYIWIEEEVLPKLLSLDNVCSLKVSVANGEMPNSLELKTRWLQELYPVDILLSESLHMKQEHISFSIEAELPSTYVIEAINKEGVVQASFHLDVPTSRLRYIDGQKFVNPTTGLLEIKSKENGSLLFNKCIPTDRERFWSFLMDDVIPELEKTVDNADVDQGITKPLFQHVRFDVQMSEEERKLNIDEERISSLEALHEDIYFNLLDYFEYLGERSAGKPFTAPGGIHPFMNVVIGSKPFAQVTAYGWTANDISKVSTRTLYFNVGYNKPIAVDIERGSEDSLESLHLLADKWESVDSFYNTEEELRELEEIPGVHIWRGGISYQGSDIPVIEVYRSSSSTWVSPHSLSTWKPTLLIETGHHANEVSSMPSILRLIKKIVTSHPEWLNAFNLVAIPCANMDGRALHRQLTKDNPEWKHHAARYNYVGLEFTKVRYEQTEFGEADVIPAIIYRWLPDIMIDDHGIPGHEWVQPFAGYNSPPRFPVSHWMPNALIYGIARQLNNEEFPKHYQLLDEMIFSIASKVKQDSAVQLKNAYWKERYKKYGHQWLPDVFPLEETDDLLFYRWNSKASRDSKAYIERYPEWCSVDLISEVADETVYDETLELCIQAHELFNLGIIEWLVTHPQSIYKETNESTISYKRIRPLSTN